MPPPLRHRHRDASPTLFRDLPLRSSLLFYGGVFLLFGPIGVLIVTSFAQQRPLWKTAYWVALGGIVGVLWSMGGTLSKRFYILAAIVSIFFGYGWATRFPAALAIETTRPNADGLGFAIVFVASYVLLAIFIAGEGSRRIRLQTEMNLARDIHATLVPSIDASSGPLTIHGVSHASSEMGGDLIELVEHDRGALDVIIADVAGHGVKAGLVMAMVKSAIRMGMRNEAPLPTLLADLNRTIAEITTTEMFCTLAWLRRSQSADSLEYSAAGHPPALIRRADSGAIERIEADALPLGIDEHEQFPTRTIALADGDTLILYTDGLTEAASPSGALLGLEGLEQLLEQHAGDSPDSLSEHLIDGARAHAGAGASQGDDQSIIAIRAV